MYKKYKTTGIKGRVRHAEATKKIKNEYIYYPFYDTKNNSFIKRYRLWVKYKKACASYNVEPIGLKEFKSVILKINSRIPDIILDDVDGINIFGLKLSLYFVKTHSVKTRDIVHSMLYPIIKIRSAPKTKKIFRASDWILFADSSFLKKIKSKEITYLNKFEIIGKHGKENINYYDMFNDF